MDYQIDSLVLDLFQANGCHSSAKTNENFFFPFFFQKKVFLSFFFFLGGGLFSCFFSFYVARIPKASFLFFFALLHTNRRRRKRSRSLLPSPRFYSRMRELHSLAGLLVGPLGVRPVRDARAMQACVCLTGDVSVSLFRRLVGISIQKPRSFGWQENGPVSRQLCVSYHFGEGEYTLVVVSC